MLKLLPFKFKLYTKLMTNLMLKLWFLINKKQKKKIKDVFKRHEPVYENKYQ